MPGMGLVRDGTACGDNLVIVTMSQLIFMRIVIASPIFINNIDLEY